VQQAQRDQAELLGHQGQLVFQEHKDPMERLVLGVLLVVQGHLGIRVFQVQQVVQDLVDKQVLQELLGFQGQLEQVGQRDQVAQQVPMEELALLDLQAPLDQVALQGPKALQDLSEVQDPLDQRVLTEQLDLQDLLV